MNPMRITKLGAIGALAALLAVSGSTAEAQQQRYFVRSAAPQAAAGGGGEARVKMVQTDDDGREVVIEMRNGELVAATLDGEKVPSDRIKLEGGQVFVLGEGGKMLMKMNAAPGEPGAAAMYRFGELEGLENLRVFGGMGGEGEHTWAFGQPGEAPSKVMLGVSLAEPDRSLREHFDLEPGQATMLLSVYDGLPAASAGLRAYDVVVGIGGKSAGMNDLRSAMRKAEPGDSLELTVIQGGKRRDVTVKLLAHDAEKLEAAAKAYREKLAADGEQLGFFDFNVIPPAPPAPPLPPGAQGRGGQDAVQLRQELLRRMETDARAKGEDARRRAEEMMKDAEARQRRAEVQAQGRQRESGEQLERLEDRMERLERLLEKLAEDQETKRRGGGD